MRIKNVLSTSVIRTELASDTKEEVMYELLDILIEAGKISADRRDQVFEDLMDREKKMSTGIQHGVAIPHAKTKAVSSLVACIGIKREGLEFDSLDGQKSTLFIMTISPIDRVGPHVQFLAEISQIIKNLSSRKALLEAHSAQEVLSVFGL
ncbi:MAG: PTS sugar transporter subunit IIA [Sphaerochaetaceae bacterium]|nr:PTS sugar transporter subunit IIA [Sphaerochaetaceae bacterium]